MFEIWGHRIIRILGLWRCGEIDSTRKSKGGYDCVSRDLVIMLTYSGSGEDKRSLRRSLELLYLELLLAVRFLCSHRESYDARQVREQPKKNTRRELKLPRY